jgi:hypothetical protein
MQRLIAGALFVRRGAFSRATGARHEPVSDKSSDDYHVHHRDRAFSCCDTGQSGHEQHQAFEEAQEDNPDEPDPWRSLVDGSGVAEPSSLVEQQVLHSGRQDLFPGDRLRDMAASDRRRSRPKGYRPRSLRQKFGREPFRTQRKPVIRAWRCEAVRAGARQRRILPYEPLSRRMPRCSMWRARTALRGSFALSYF